MTRGLLCNIPKVLLERIGAECKFPEVSSGSNSLVYALKSDLQLRNSEKTFSDRENILCLPTTISLDDAVRTGVLSSTYPLYGRGRLRKMRT